jgi:cell division protein FtsQ
MLKKYGDNPGGKILSDVDMNEIEREIEKHPMVRRAVCYQSPNGDLNIDVTQRIPVFRVMSAAGDYYVDNERSKMPVTVKSSAYVTVVSGNVNLDFALGELYDFVVYLQSDNFFNSLVEQIYIYPNNRMELIPRVGDFVIVFGTTERYEAKLKKMKVFYETVPQRMGWNSYSKINLEYKDQVVCTRR